MDIIRSIKAIRAKVEEYFNSGYVTGLVPTMGFLHAGHLSLIENIRPYTDKIIVSIFVNPKQFSANENLQLYPTDEEGDIKKCKNAGANIVYIPSVEAMYPDDFSTSIDIGPLSTLLCGKSRPNHFNGIMLVIVKLLMQIQPQVAIFGEKDYQMLFLIRKLIEELNINISILQSPIIRAEDGLALSSRNSYLTSSERNKANLLYNSIVDIAYEFRKNPSQLQDIINNKRDFLESNNFHVDYVELRNSNTLEKISTSNEQARIFAAAYLGKCRLIDNIAIDQ